ncbi:MAG: PRC-barrel domain-containing protein [Rhodospirillum sp.]|nr:PRC-barrel domain-containing protein [Rhodospirillum sp.]MCF8487802.1 PRC-barrel domain-containing protein [Rhodospirillum sp.]MCF8499900.1 PRC-barrel domain-containing protein [Rhodospirillum sp.]
MRLPFAAPLALPVLAIILAGSATAQTPEATQPPAVEETLDSLPSLEGPIAAQDLLGLPVRTYGGAPPVAVVDDLLITIDGVVDKLVLDDGTFLRMGLGGKRVALPYDAAIAVPGPDGLPVYLRINIAKAYGQVIKEFLYDLISPKNYAVKAIIGGPVSAVDAPGAARVTGLTVSQGGKVTTVELDLNPGSTATSWPVTLPFSDLRISRPGPKEETRLSTPLTLNQLRIRDAANPGGITDLEAYPSEPSPSPPMAIRAYPAAPVTPTAGDRPMQGTPPLADTASPSGWSPAPGVVLPETPPPDVPSMR